jgi:trimeric autotransporter adhesin
VALLLMAQVVACPITASGQAASGNPAAGGSIQGVVKSGNTPIPGATVTASNTLTGQKVTTWTNVAGQYSLRVPASGRYVVKAQMAAFATVTGETIINASTPAQRVDLEIVLSSRSQTPTDGSNATQGGSERASAGAGRGYQSLSVLNGEGAGLSASAGSDPTSSLDTPLAGVSPNIATSSVSVSGNATASDFQGGLGGGFDDRRNDFSTGGTPGTPGAPGTQRGGPGGPGGSPAGATAGGGGGFGGFGGGGFGGGGFGGFPGGSFRGRFDVNKPHGSLYYTAGASALNASPYSLTGLPSTNPGYLQQRFGANLGGPLKIPKIYNGGSKTFFFLNYNASLANNPYDAFSTVPTAEERAGNFADTKVRDSSGHPVGLTLYDPVTHQLICSAGSGPCAIPAGSISPVATGILAYVPQPNVPGRTTKNFHYVTSTTNNVNDLNFRLNRTLGKGAAGPPMPGRRGPQNSVSFGFHFHDADNALTDPFPTVGGKTTTRSFDIPVGYTRSFGKLNNIFRVDYNRSRISTNNLYPFQQETIAQQLGLQGVSTSPFDNGLPSLSLTNYSGLQDTVPLLQRNQTFTFSDFMILNHGKHTWRWGGDFRRIQINTETVKNGRGSFVFTGLNTSGNTPTVQVNAGPSGGFGYDFADFLYGLPQQTSVQFGCSTAGVCGGAGDDSYHFRGNSWDLFAQDEWRLRGNLTLNLGVRYEYVSPYTEASNRIVNLDVAPGVAAVQPVQPGQAGLNGSRFPITLLNPDRNNFAPRLGIAWKARGKTVIRAGYGINYSTSAYQGIVQQLAFQPPFSLTQTNIEAATGDLTLQNGFPPVAAGTITNNYGVDRNYRLGYVQIWNADMQQEITPTLLLNISYNGTKGTRLDIVESPNRTANGVLLANVQPFLFENSLGDSTSHSGTIRMRKRLQRGLAVSGSYTWSKAIDDASSIGGGSTSVAQDALHLSAERGLSIFDQRHRFTGDYTWELPLGHEKRWLSQKSALRDILGDWQWTADWTIASGTPFSPRIVGNTTDVSRGSNGTLRPDVTGVPIALANRSISEWFNTAAFTSTSDSSGNVHFGDARRDSIIGPGSLVFDMAMTKSFPLRENRSVELRAQASNVFNKPQFASIDTNFNSPTFGQVTSVGAMRTIQFTGRFRF